ncbi:hypothetical protein WJX72_009482 [[Myrmecia] bisecta]|uniref:Uncharacterized protein n=1 Tax=[Myrmecia] bisecta TaxID=41462 RepID=A0AAW1PET5_9CHLO
MIASLRRLARMHCCVSRTRRALKHASAYDRTEPATPALLHAAFDKALREQVARILRQAKKDNEAVYFQPVPTEADALPATRLVAPLPFALPTASGIPFPMLTAVSQPAGQLQGGEVKSAAQQGTSGGGGVATAQKQQIDSAV